MSARDGLPPLDPKDEGKGRTRPKVVVLAGPTASGKTSLAVDLALEFEGEIVNADSMQVFRGMDVGTAKPGEEERKSVPHHLLSVADPDEPFNAAAFRVMALAAVRDIHARGKACFVVGGTGLYIKGLLGGLFRCPPSDPALRRSSDGGGEPVGGHGLVPSPRAHGPGRGRIHSSQRSREGHEGDRDCGLDRAPAL